MTELEVISKIEASLEQAASKPKTNRLKAIIAINLSAMCLPISGVFIKEATAQKAETGEFVLVRALCTFFVAGMILMKTKTHIWSDIPTGKFKFCIIRAFCSLIGFGSGTLSFQLMPLGISVVITYMAPFWTSLLAYVFNREPIFKHEYVSMIVCFIGVIGITFGGRHEEKPLAEPESSNWIYILGALAALITSFSLSGGAVTNRRLHDVSVGILISYMASLAATSSLLFFSIRYLITGQTFLYYEKLETYGWVIGACLIELFNPMAAIIAY